MQELTDRAPLDDYFVRAQIPVKFTLTIKVPADATAREMQQAVQATLRSITNADDFIRVRRDIPELYDAALHFAKEVEKTQDLDTIFIVKTTKVLDAFTAPAPSSPFKETR